MADPARSLLATPLIIAVAVLAAAAHGDLGSAAGSRTQAGDLVVSPSVAVAVAVAEVTMTDQVEFEPSTVTIKPGQTVEWTNPSRLVHTVTADPEKVADREHVQLPGEAETFDSGVIRPGETYRQTFTVPGTYRYFCIPHEAAGMVAEIVVEDQ